MARRPEKPAADPQNVDIGKVFAALEQVTQALNATNERLAQVAESLARLPSMQGATMQLAGAAAADDEAVLRSLAQSHSLNAAMERLISYRNDRLPASRPRYWGIINFNLHSANRRLFIFDVAGQKVTGYLCAHGRGSEGPTDDGFANVFSNQDGSNASSLGIYRCSETYQGDHGYSMRLDGLESMNSNARHRAIVVHGADYVSPQTIQSTGRIGRSLGCPAVENQLVTEVVDALKFGSLLLAWKS